MSLRESHGRYSRLKRKNDIATKEDLDSNKSPDSLSMSVFDEVSEESSSLSSPASPSPSLQKGRYLQITNLDSHKVSFSSKNPKH